VSVCIYERVIVQVVAEVAWSV